MYRYLILILVLIIFGNVIAFCPQEFRAPPAHIPELSGTAQLRILPPFQVRKLKLTERLSNLPKAKKEVWNMIFRHLNILPVA